MAIRILSSESVSGVLTINTNDASGNRIGFKGDGATTGTAIHTNWRVSSPLLAVYVHVFSVVFPSSFPFAKSHLYQVMLPLTLAVAHVNVTVELTLTAFFSPLIFGWPDGLSAIK